MIASLLRMRSEIYMIMNKEKMFKFKVKGQTVSSSSTYQTVRTKEGVLYNAAQRQEERVIIEKESRSAEKM